MKRPVLKRIVKTVEIVTWTLEYEDVPTEELADGQPTADSAPHPSVSPDLPTPTPTGERLDT